MNKSKKVLVSTSVAKGLELFIVKLVSFPHGTKPGYPFSIVILWYTCWFLHTIHYTKGPEGACCEQVKKGAS